MNAVKNVFIDADVSGCYFHFQKAVKKKSKELKLYETRAGRKFTRMVAHLPLLPEDLIRDCWISMYFRNLSSK